MDATMPVTPGPSLPNPPADERAAPLAVPEFRPDPQRLVPDARAFLTAGREAIRRLHEAGASGRAVVRATSELMDRLMSGLFAALSDSDPDLPPVALVALGGYGRRELAPRSDIDTALIYAGPAKPPEGVAQLAERLLYVLWDLKLEVGWGVRNASQCAELAKSDHTARTAMLDCRYLAGSGEVYAELERAVLGELLTRSADAFIAEKTEELQRRRLKYGDTVYLLEPNLKQSEGGLRDLQAALWIARVRFRAAGVSDLLHRSILPPREVDELLAARDFLWRVRNALHYATGRKEDRLTFDMQVLIAEQMSYRDGPEGLPVEQFMRHYYLAASIIKRATDALVARCEEGRRRSRPLERRLDHEFKVWDGRLTLCDRELFARDPAAIVRLFAVADREGLPLHSWVRDRVRQEAWRIDAAVRASPDVTATLRQMFVRPGTRGEFLGAMHELGALAAVLPEFAPATARTQHDLYHVYTVDAHSLFAVTRLYQLRNGEIAEREPSLTRLMQGLQGPLPLYLAALLHDAAKSGTPGHAERGAQLMRSAARRLELAQQDADDAEFLVAKHLLMSHVSQRRDLTDPNLIDAFAAEVGTPDRLLMLYLLTYADMASVGPGIWNDWRSRLLEELYVKAQASFDGQREPGEPSARVESLRREMVEHFPAPEVDAFLGIMPERYLRSATAFEAARHLRLLRRGRERPVSAALFHRAGYTELTLTSPDRPGLLAVYAGALAAHGIDIMHAEIFSTADGRAVDAFTVQRPGGGPIERERWRGARADIEAALQGKLDVHALLQRRGSRGLMARFVPRVATHVAIDNRAAADATVIDVYAQDRTGLLHTIAQVLFEHGIEIFLAKVGTEGNRVSDGFYVRRQGRKVEDAELLGRVERALREALQ